MHKPDYKPLVSRLRKRTGGRFRPASPYRISQIKKLGFPEEAVAFYRRYEPSDLVEGCIRLLPIEMIMVENTRLMPGCYSAPQGFPVFASTFAGDVYCFDVGERRDGSCRIVLLSHELVRPGIKRRGLLRIVEPVAEDLSQFLQMFVDDALDVEESD